MNGAGAGRILSRRFPPENCDPRALQVARQLQERENPQLLILFGSRVRGDWEEGRSDIDLLLVTERGDDWDEYVRVADDAQAIAQAVYGDYVSVQTLPFSPAEFQKTRRSLNHVTARALREGVLMPRNPEEYQHQYGDDEDFAYEGSVAEERIRRSHLHLNDFKEKSAEGEDDTLIGQAAQAAMEHALKALISINGMEYPTIHEIGQLTERARQADPEFRGRQRLHPRFYNQYAGRDEYRPTPGHCPGWKTTPKSWPATFKPSWIGCTKSKTGGNRPPLLMFAFLFRSRPANLRRSQPRRSQPAAEPEDDAAWLVYDGECPLCRNYARYLAARQSLGQLRLVNARDGGPLAQEVRDLPHNPDDGMVLKLHGRYYQGADALYRLAWQSDRRGFFGRLNGLLFRSATAARLGYPLLKLGRRCLLKLKGVPPLD